MLSATIITRLLRLAAAVADAMRISTQLSLNPDGLRPEVATRSAASISDEVDAETIPEESRQAGPRRDYSIPQSYRSIPFWPARPTLVHC